MGISLAWVAVQGLATDIALERLALKPTGLYTDLPTGGGEIAMHAMPGDWLLVAAHACDHRIGHAESMAALSLGCRAVFCAVEEHVNFALSEYWEDGKRRWQVSFEGCEEPNTFASEGDLPPLFHTLVATATSNESVSQEEHCIDEIPLMLAKDLAGFRHDETNPSTDGSSFERLEDLRPKRPWWRIWK